MHILLERLNIASIFSGPKKGQYVHLEFGTDDKIEMVKEKKFINSLSLKKQWIFSVCLFPISPFLLSLCIGKWEVSIQLSCNGFPNTPKHLTLYLVFNLHPRSRTVKASGCLISIMQVIFKRKQKGERLGNEDVLVIISLELILLH